MAVVINSKRTSENCLLFKRKEIVVIYEISDI